MDSISQVGAYASVKRFNFESCVISIIEPNTNTATKTPSIIFIFYVAKVVNEITIFGLESKSLHTNKFTHTQPHSRV